MLVGPTAIGKTALSIKLASCFDFEIISVDSMQVYRYMDIGTAKISEEEMKGIPHHLINVVNPDEDFDAEKFEKLAIDAIEGIISRKKRVLLTGGTGLYLRAILSGLSQRLPSFPDIRTDLQKKLALTNNKTLHEQLIVTDSISAKRIHENDTRRVIRALEIFKGTGKPWSAHIQDHKANASFRFPNVLQLGLTCDRKKLYERVGQRSLLMLKGGLKEEVQGLLEKGYGPELKPMQAIGYKHMLSFLSGEWNQSTMIENLARDTRRYAKRQYTWFNKEKEINWFEKKDENAVLSKVSKFINGFSAS